MARWTGAPTGDLDWHVIPLNDLVTHEESESCSCGPTPELVPNPAGDAWLYTHHSLDGREAHETPTKETR